MLLPIEVFHAKAAQRGGDFLSTENKGVGVPHEWECHKHGVFWATPRDVLYGREEGTWCPKCGIEKNNRTKMDWIKLLPTSRHMPLSVVVNVSRNLMIAQIKHYRSVAHVVMNGLLCRLTCYA
ncbi:MAG: hypothetical protein JJE30_10960 [Desulfuromonadales bacterium]|nr:hypothetical protein [Desulfuromonadales bacterium]